MSDYAYNPAGHLRRVRHRAGSSLRGQFNYTVDGRGNRTRAFERLAQSTTVSATYNKSASQVTFPRGTWTDAGDFKQTAQFSGQMQIAYTGDEALLTIGTGPDHGMIDISINDNYWRSFNTYTAQPGERVLHIPQVTTPTGETTGTLEIRNRSDRHHRSTGHVFRFKQLAVIDTTYTDTTIDYTYDALSRLTQADYDDGTTVYDYAYDLAGNLTNNNGTGQPPVVRTFNAANQMTNDGTHTLTYDPNGNLMSDGTNTYTWDRANRMLSVDNGTLAEKVSYAYDGLGNRVSMSVGTTSPTVTDYLLDVQPGLVKVLAQTTGATTDRFVHSPRGIHAMQDNASDWRYMTQDGLGSVRSEIDEVLMVGAAQHYAPYGEPFGTVGNFDTPFAFTGEQVDSTGQVYLRARYYNPSMGVFNSLDPFEAGNRYAYASGNPINQVDPTGLYGEIPSSYAKCTGMSDDGLNPLQQGSQLSGAYNESICPWTDVEKEELLPLVPEMRQLASKWNVILDGFGATIGTGLSNDVFVATMVSILRVEGQFRQRRSLDCRLELRCTGSPISIITCGPELVCTPDTNRRVENEVGDQAFILLGRDSSIGIANLRPSVYGEILGIPDGNEVRTNVYQDSAGNYQRFEVGDRLDHYGELHALRTRANDRFRMGEAMFVRQQLYDEYYNNDLVALEFLAANLLRGIERVGKQDIGEIADSQQIRPSIFNLANWHNLGQQGKQITRPTLYGSVVIREAWRILEGPCRDLINFNVRSEQIPYFDPLEREQVCLGDQELGSCG